MSLKKNFRILITRGQEQAEEFAGKIRSAGATPLFLPTMWISPLDNYDAFDNVLRRQQFDWLVFTSSNTVKYFFNRLERVGKSLGPCKVAAVGAKTGQALAAFHVRADLVPEKFTAADLGQAFENEQIAGKKVLLPVSSIARQELEESLRGLGAQVERVVAYKVESASPDKVDEVRTQLENRQIDCVTFFSPSAVRGYVQLMGNNSADMLAKNQVVVAVIGPTTAAAARQVGFAVDIVPERSDQETLLNVIIRHFEKHDVAEMNSVK